MWQVVLVKVNVGQQGDAPDEDDDDDDDEYALKGLRDALKGRRKGRRGPNAEAVEEVMARHIEGFPAQRALVFQGALQQLHVAAPTRVVLVASPSSAGTPADFEVPRGHVMQAQGANESLRG